MNRENKLKVLLYAAETWTLKEADKKKLLAFKMKCYRRILKINWRHGMKRRYQKNDIEGRGHN